MTPVTTFRTISGSLYEVDETSRVVRLRSRIETRGGSARLAGGEWLPYRDVFHDGVGSRLYIDLDDGPGVVTSEIVEVADFNWDHN